MKQITAVKRNKNGTYTIKPFKDSNFSGIAFLLTTMAIGYFLHYLSIPPLEPINPLISINKVEAQEFGVLPTTNLKPEPTTVSNTSRETVQARLRPVNPYRAITERYATKYGVDANLMDCIMFHESSYRADASNLNSSARGIAQFLKGTWVWMRTKMGADTQLNLREDVESATETLAWALSKGYKNHWQVVTNGSCK